MATDVQLAECPLMSPKAKLKPEKKSGRKPRSPGDSRPQKELVIPGIVDFERIRQALRTPKPQTPGTYCFGRLSHHSFFSRHHPHPQHVTHIQASNPLQISPGSLFVSSGTLQPPCLSQLSFPVKWGCQPSLPSLETHSLIGTPSFLLKEEEEEPLREQGAKYSAETGRLIPASTRAVGRRRSHQGQQSQSSSRDEGVQAFRLQDQELLVLELLCQILETDSLSAIQFWLLYAPPKEKDLALGLLQTAVAQLLPQPLVSIPTEKLLNQLQDVHQPPQEKQEPPCSQSPKKTKMSPFSKSEKPGKIPSSGSFGGLTKAHSGWISQGIPVNLEMSPCPRKLLISSIHSLIHIHSLTNIY
ncbi:PREDICTED: protein TBATA isoform X8 [Cercocebus atys]|uniref:protein TBATA isoform X8 n=1 Tax=Cercocebus atys TaxID=9531 RepID=UPI0005F37A9E|nr:PREDICTED: protein TBATA isoform X8 [Cercocebus atys]